MKQLSQSFLFQFLVLSLASFTEVQARPVSYQGGVTAMTRNNWRLHRLHIHYTPHPSHSLGLAVEDFRQDDRTNLLLQWNSLLYRKNRRRSQANLYSLLEAGAAFGEEQTEPLVELRLAGDWESRRYFASYVGGVEYARDLDNGSFHQKVRAGVAPYIGAYGSFHSWIMLQFEHHPEEEVSRRLGPVLRFFKGEFLLEIGVDNQRDYTFNFVVRY